MRGRVGFLSEKLKVKTGALFLGIFPSFSMNAMY